ncbi:MAG: histidine kinase [Sphingomonas bacterium]|nr:histidine kinase [Sphingomonas bacterium]
MASAPPNDLRRFADWRLALKTILGFWLIYALTVVARALLGSDPLALLQNKLLTLGVGIVLTFLVYAAIAMFGGQDSSNRRKAIVAGIASFLAACAMAGLLMLADGKMRESKEIFRHTAKEGVVIFEQGNKIRIERTAAEPLVLTLPALKDIEASKKFRYAADAAVIWLFFFAAWSAFYLATIAQAQALRAQRRAAAAETAAHTAQVRALRYQVNPHFLFNTLNSLSSLVMTGRTERAEEMLLALSTFFRTSLSLNPVADVTLAEEIDLQRLYLDIETIRFPSRLKVAIDVPKDLEDVRLPALILQPLVENAIKYGVSPTSDVVTLTIAAEAIGDDRLLLRVTNSGSKAPPKRRGRRDSDRIEGTGVGLANVCQRIEARFGAAATCEFGPLDNGGFEVRLAIPRELHDG